MPLCNETQLARGFLSLCNQQQYPPASTSSTNNENAHATENKFFLFTNMYRFSQPCQFCDFVVLFSSRWENKFLMCSPVVALLRILANGYAHGEGNKASEGTHHLYKFRWSIDCHFIERIWMVPMCGWSLFSIFSPSPCWSYRPSDISLDNSNLYWNDKKQTKMYQGQTKTWTKKN